MKGRKDGEEERESDSSHIYLESLAEEEEPFPASVHTPFHLLLVQMFLQEGPEKRLQSPTLDLHVRQR